MKNKYKMAMIASLFLTNSAVVSSELDTLIETSGAIVSQIDRGILMTGAAIGFAHTGTGISDGQLAGTAYISSEQVTAYSNALTGMVSYLPYGSAEDYLNEQAQSELDAMNDAIDDFTTVVVDMLAVQQVSEMAEDAVTPDEQAEVQAYVAANDMSISQEDADTYNQSLDLIEESANNAGAFLAVAGNPEAVAFLDQGAMDNNTRIEDNGLSYSASNQSVNIAWASSNTVSSIYMNSQDQFNIDVYASHADILNEGASTALYLTGPTYLGWKCFTTGVCEEDDGT
jgi:hypothetical protein